MGSLKRARTRPFRCAHFQPKSSPRGSDSGRSFSRLGASISLTIGFDLALAAVLLLIYKQQAFGAQAGRIALPVAGALLGVAILIAILPPAGWDQVEMTRGVYYRPQDEMDFGIALEPIEGIVENEILYYQDGLNTTVSIHRTPGGIDMRLNGKPDASLLDMSTQVLGGWRTVYLGPSLSAPTYG